MPGSCHNYSPPLSLFKKICIKLYADDSLNSEFKELRKQWRKAKKEEAEVRSLGRQGSQHPSQHHIPREPMSDAEYQSYHLRSHLDSAHHLERFSQPATPLDDLHDPEAHQRDVYARRQQRFSAFVSPHTRNSRVAHHPSPHRHGLNVHNVPMNRLPANSTLLTPLPGYEPPAMGGIPDLDFCGSYDVYNSDDRPGTGHGSVGGYDHRRRSSMYPGDGRPRSSHVNMDTGHGLEYQEQ
jgi:hypothetical protein